MQYKLSADEADIVAAAYTTCRLWRQLTPQIMVMKPMSDLCWVCQQNSRAIMRSANTPEEEKSQVTKRTHTEGGLHTFIHINRRLKMPRHTLTGPHRRGRIIGAL